MKGLLVLIAISILLPGTPVLADYQKGQDAFDSGDFTNAFKEWKPLAEQGNADAQFHLGVMYDKGRGVPQCYKAAIKWYSLAAEQGNASAQFHLGYVYENGKGVTRNYKNAFQWYRGAAEQGHAEAQANLGAMYARGDGVRQNYTRAHMWWNIAGSQGDADASEYRDVIAKQLSPTQIETAQQLARECVAKNYKGC